MTADSDTGTAGRLLVERGLWGVLAVALVLRSSLLLRYRELPVSGGDEPLHYMMAALVPHFGHQVLGQWAPGYEAFNGALFALFGTDPSVVRLAQVALSTVGVGLVYAMAHRAGGPRAAWIAGLLWALNPSSVAYTGYFFSETLFSTLLLAGAAQLLAGRAIWSGWWFGLAALTRSVALYALPAWALWSLLRGRREEARSAALALGVALLTISPWTLRNAVRYGDFLLIDGTMSSTLHAAYNTKLLNMDLGYSGWRAGPEARPPCEFALDPDLRPLPPRAEVEAWFPPDAPLPFEKLSEIRRYTVRDYPAALGCESAAAIAFARANPATIASHYARRVYAFWGPNSFLLRSVATGRYAGGPLDATFYRWVRDGFIGIYAFAILAALLSLASRPVARASEWFALLAVVFTALHVAAVAWSRYRFPLMPFAAVAASLWLANPSLPQRLRARVGLGLAIAAFLGLVVHYAATRLP